MKSLFTKLVLFSQAGRGGQAAELWSTIPSTEAKKIQSAVQLPAEKPWQQSAAAASPSRFRDALLTGSDELPRRRRNKNGINQSPGNSNMLKHEPGWTYSWGGAGTETQAHPSEPETRRASLHGFLSGFSLSPDCDYEEDEMVTQMDRC